MKQKELERDLKELVELYGGKDAIQSALDALPDNFAHIPDAEPRSVKGAPPIGEGRDAFVFALMDLIRIGTDQSMPWCAEQIVKDCEITFYDPQHRGRWKSTLKKPGTISRIYYSARRKWAADADYKKAVAQNMWTLLWWQQNAVNPTLGFGGMVFPPTGLHKQFTVRSAQCPCVNAIGKAREILGIDIERVDLKKLRD